MKSFILPVLAVMGLSCQNAGNESTPEADASLKDNVELRAICEHDQADRESEDTDWQAVSGRDSLRRFRVRQLLDSGLVRTSTDFETAALVFVHGTDSMDYGLAVKLMEKSIELDSTTLKWLLAVATDRYLLSTGHPQIYGTQIIRTGDAPWRLAEIDTTKISERERTEFGIETLAQQREKVDEMNRERIE